MTIPNISQNDPDFFQGLSHIAEALGNIIQPYKGTELALQGLIARNPELAQKFADMEYLQPGSIKGLFGPNAGKYFGDMAPSAGAAAQKVVREQVPRVMGKSPQDLLDNNAPYSQIAAAQAITGETPGKSESELYSGILNNALAQEIISRTPEGQAFLLHAGAKLTPGGYAASQVQAGTLDPEVVKSIYSKPDVMGSYVKGLTGQQGGYSPQEMAAIATKAGPLAGIWNVIQSGLGTRLAEERLKTLRELGAMKIGASQSNQENALHRLLIYNTVKQANEMGITPGSLAALNFGPESPLVNELGGFTPEQLQQAQGAAEQAGNQFGARGLNGAMTSINNLIRTYYGMKQKGAKPTELAPIIDAMNSVGERFGQSYWYNKDQGLMGTDNTGQVQTEQQLESRILSSGPITGTRTPKITPPPNPATAGTGPGGTRTSVNVSGPAGTQIPENVQRYLNALNSPHTNKSASLARLKATNPDLYKQVIAADPTLAAIR